MDNDMLSSLLNDPTALQNAMKTVSDLFGSGTSSAAPAAPDYDPSAELVERALPVVSAVLQSGQSAVSREKRALLGALKPFVTDEVAGQFDHAVRLVSMARMARAALGQIGTGGTAGSTPAAPPSSNGTAAL